MFQIKTCIVCYSPVSRQAWFIGWLDDCRCRWQHSHYGRDSCPAQIMEESEMSDSRENGELHSHKLWQHSHYESDSRPAQNIEESEMSDGHENGELRSLKRWQHSHYKRDSSRVQNMEGGQMSDGHENDGFSPTFSPVRGAPSMESSVDDPYIVDISADNSVVPLTYQIVHGSSKRHRDQLITSDGHAYTIRRRLKGSIHWQCTARPKVNPCKASVIQASDGTFKPGKHEHNHPGSVGADMVAKVNKKIKEESNPQELVQICYCSCT